MSSTLVVHHLRVSQSESIVWLCEELGIDYKLVCHDRDQATKLAPDAYKALSPLRTAPVIEDIDTYTPNPEHIRLAESQACVEWICRKHGQGRLLNKPWDAHWKEWLFWWHFTHGSFQPICQMLLLASSLPSDHPGLKVATSRLSHYLSLIEARLSESKFLVGDELTAADIMIVFPLTTQRAFVPIDLTEYPNILRYLKEIAERPAYQKAFEKAETTLKPIVDAIPKSPFSI
ncbi:glutathione S-transferase-like protein [Aureobasidium subglaciale]|nr:glutathione S-transferase-like protein [Aureobasidium subglaciale]